MAPREQRYRQAAVTYLIYGLIYLGGAVYLAAVDAVARSGWAWFAVGAAFILVLPPLIWFQYKWVTRILAILVGVRILGLVRTTVALENEAVRLPWGGDLRMRYGALVFLVVAIATVVMLVRAGWVLPWNQESS